jgi:hypothetical protein
LLLTIEKKKKKKKKNKQKNKNRVHDSFDDKAQRKGSEKDGMLRLSPFFDPFTNVKEKKGLEEGKNNRNCASTLDAA